MKKNEVSLNKKIVIEIGIILVTLLIFLILLTTSILYAHKRHFVFDENRKIIEQAYRMKSTIYAIDKEISLMIFQDEAYEVNLNLEEIKVSEAEFYLSLDEINYVITDEEGLYSTNSLWELMQQWSGLKTMLVNVMNQGDMEKTILVKENEISNYFDLVLRMINQIEVYGEEHAKKAEEQDYVDTRLIIIIIVVGGVFLGAEISGLILLIRKDMITGIRSLSESLNKTIDNEAYRNVSLKGNVELEALSEIINRLISSLGRRLWVREGNLNLGRILSSSDPMQMVIDEYIIALCQYMGLISGAYYHLEFQTLNFYSGYNRQPYMEDTYEYGAYRVGEVAIRKERRTTLYSEEKAGDGAIPFYSIITIPIGNKDYMIGVLDIVCRNSLNDEQEELLTVTLRELTYYIESYKQRNRIDRLLNESMEANQELKQRQQALEVNQKQLEKQNVELLSLKSELIEKYKTLSEMAKYKSQFMANISHELRTPLNSIIVLSDILHDTDGCDDNIIDERKGQLKVINKAGKELLTLIDDILELSKLENHKVSLNISTFSLSSLLEELKGQFTPMIESKGLEASFSCDKDCLLNTDRPKIKQILVNFVSNAYKFTEKGRIAIEATMDGDETFPLSIKVQDTGIGIKNEKKDIIFEEFKQSDETIHSLYGGTGLGLAISKEFAELVGGRIEVTSLVDEGSTFELILPSTVISNISEEAMVDDIMTSMNRKRPNIDGIYLDTKKILVCCDDPSLVFEITGYVEETSAMVRGCVDVEQLYKYLMEEHRYSMVLVSQSILEDLNNLIPIEEVLEQLNKLCLIGVIQGSRKTKVLENERFSIVEKEALYQQIYELLLQIGERSEL